MKKIMLQALVIGSVVLAYTLPVMAYGGGGPF